MNQRMQLWGLHAEDSGPARRLAGRMHPVDGMTHPTALRAAVGWGVGRLFAVAPRTRVPRLPRRTARAAARQLRQMIAQCVEEIADSLRPRPTIRPYSRRETSVSWIEKRMTAWAAFLAIDATYSDGLDNDDSELTDEMDELLSAIERFDEALQLAEPFSFLAADSQRLGSWIEQLASPYRDHLPWWLSAAADGRDAACFHCLE